MRKNLLLIPILLGLTVVTTSIARPYSETSVSPSSTSIFRDESVSDIQSYYSSLNDGLSGENLLSSLQTVLKTGQKTLPKSTSSTWTNYVLADRDWTQDPLTSEEESSQTWKTDNVVCAPLYDTTFTFDSTQKPGNKVNREHVLPKSYGFGNTSDSVFLPIAATDMQNLHMGEARNNQQGHNNYAYGNVVDKSLSTTKAITSTISGEVTGYLGYSKTNILVYEPMDKDKGDIARTIFYMAARYHTYDATVENSPSLKLSDTPTDVYTNKTTITAEETKNNPCEYGILSDLLDWNDSDPVDDHEIHRNNLVYNAIQSNRNPFIDYPSWARIAYDATSTKTIDKSVNPTQVATTTEPTDPSTPKYTLTINYSEGSNQGTVVTGSYAAGTVVTLKQPTTKEGYTFDGFYLNSDFSGEAITTYTTKAQDEEVYIYMKYTKDVNILDQILGSKYGIYIIIAIAVVVILVIILLGVNGSKKKKRKSSSKSTKSKKR